MGAAVHSIYSTVLYTSVLNYIPQAQKRSSGGRTARNMTLVIGPRCFSHRTRKRRGPLAVRPRCEDSPVEIVSFCVQWGKQRSAGTAAKRKRCRSSESNLTIIFMFPWLLLFNVHFCHSLLRVISRVLVHYFDGNVIYAFPKHFRR